MVIKYIYNFNIINLMRYINKAARKYVPNLYFYMLVYLPSECLINL